MELFKTLSLDTIIKISEEVKRQREAENKKNNQPERSKREDIKDCTKENPCIQCGCSCN